MAMIESTVPLPYEQIFEIFNRNDFQKWQGKLESL